MIPLLFNIGLQELILLIIISGLIALPVFALIDIVRSDFKESNTKIMWVLIVLLLPLLGSIMYFTIGRSQKVSG